MRLLRYIKGGQREDEIAARVVVEHLPHSDMAHLSIMRGRRVEDTLHIGPNVVYAQIVHADGDITRLGFGHNLLNTDGRDLIAAAQGHAAGTSGAATATSATSLTSSGFTADQYKGWRVYCPVTGLTTAPVYGNIGSNTTTVLTVDQWWTAADGTGTTPASTNGYLILPAALPRFMALTENASAAAAGNTALTGEITTGGAARALCTYAHTNDAATYTLQKSFSITASFPAIHRMALLTASTSTAAGIMVFESVLNADANVVNGDTLQVTDTVTLS